MGFKEQLLALPLKEEAIDIPGVGQAVVRELSAAEQDAYWAAVTTTDKDGKASVVRGSVRLELVARSLRNGDGQRVFADEEVAQLRAVPSSVVTRVFLAAQRLNGMDQEDGELKGN